MKEPVLEIKNFHVDYGLGDQAVQAVRDVTLTLHRGEVLGLAGESGSGEVDTRVRRDATAAASGRDQRRLGRLPPAGRGRVRRDGADGPGVA